MKIDPTGPVGPSAIRRREKAEKTRSSKFSDSLVDKTVSDKAVSGTAPISRVDSILALQEVDHEDAGRRMARERCEAVLEHLDDIQLGLLEGMVSRRTLNELSLMVGSQREKISDPKLVEILDEIELRAAVELAKLNLKA